MMGHRGTNGCYKKKVKTRPYPWAEKKRTTIMGVINVTPDSFSDGGLYVTTDDVERQAKKLLKQGADILDIGGESSRPFSEAVSVKEELKRVLPAIDAVRSFSDCLISVDTTKAEVAYQALSKGADIINDISALRFDPEMADVVSEAQVPVVLMHMKGTPQDMQKNPVYDDVIREIKEFLHERILWAQSKGIMQENVIVDPGIGFGKRFEDNLVILNQLAKFLDLNAPILVGASRKAFLGAITGEQDASKRDIATMGAVAASIMNGTSIVRVHNVEMARTVADVIDSIRNEALPQR